MALQAPAATPNFLRHYYSWYVAYLMVCAAVGAVVLKIFGGLSVTDSIFMAVCATANTGLQTIKLEEQRTVTHVTLWLLIILTNPILVSLAPVVVRCRLVRRSSHPKEHFGITTSSQDVRRALLIVIEMVVGYWVSMVLVGWLSLWLILGGHDGWNCWQTLFQTICAMHCGWNVVELPLLQSYAPAALTVLALLTMGGNTWFPIVLRLLLWLRYRLTGSGASKLLLKYPRTFYTHLFPGYANTCLLIVTALLILAQIGTLSARELLPDMPEASDRLMHGIPAGRQILAIIYNSCSTRTAGMTVLDLSKLCPTSIFVYCICMWISACPVVVVMRSTTWQRPGPQPRDGTPRGRAGFGAELARRRREAGMVGGQLSAFMSENSGKLMALLFLILFIEEWSSGLGVVGRDKLVAIIFEFCSAYGNIGLSMGSPSLGVDDCGTWAWPSQLLLALVAIMGRLRGLPETIDPTFQLHAAEDDDDDGDDHVSDSAGSDCGDGGAEDLEGGLMLARQSHPDGGVAAGSLARSGGSGHEGEADGSAREAKAEEEAAEEVAAPRPSCSPAARQA